MSCDLGPVSPVAVPAPPGEGAVAPKLSVYLEMLLLSLIFGISPVASKFSTEGFSFYLAADLRVLIGTLLFVFLLTFAFRSWARVDFAALGWFLVLGLTGFVGFSLLYFLALTMTTASHGVIMTGAGPMVTAIFSAIILGERLSTEKIGGIALTMVGIALLVVSSGTNVAAGSVPGDLAMLGAISSWSFYTIFAKKLIARYGTLLVTAYSVFAGAILLTPIALLSGARPVDLTTAPLNSWLGILFSGVFSTCLAYILYGRGIHTLGPTLTAVFANLAPIWGFGVAFWLRGEVITVWHFLSAILVIGGVTWANRSGLILAIRQPRQKGQRPAGSAVN